MFLRSGFLACAGLLAADLFGGAIIYEVTSLPSGMYGAKVEQRPFRYTYSVTGITVEMNQELDIRFDPALYGGLYNGVAPDGFLVTLLQPDNPPGFAGDYSVFALLENPPLAGLFSVDFIFLGPGEPGAQQFFINQYDASGRFLAAVASGMTAPSVADEVPEPSSFSICGLVVLMGGGWWAVRRRSGRTA
jgi:hypothetical protein